MEKMKITRNLFIITGDTELVLQAISEINFKGIVCFTDDFITRETFYNVISCNKSVVCRGFSPKDSDLEVLAIKIAIVKSDYDLVPETNAINISKGNISEQFNAIASYHHCDIGDFKSNTSASNSPFERSNCPYCTYIDNGFMDKDIGLYRTIYRSENFFVMPTIGQFVKGYLLIIPFDHVMSNGELCLEKRHEFLQVLEDATYMLKLTYGYPNFLIWENGSGNGGVSKAKTSIVHSHTHVVASNLTTQDIEKALSSPFKSISYENLNLYQKNSYLLIRESKYSWKIKYELDFYIPRQYVRQLLLYKDYTCLTDGIWDWRAYPFINKIKETCSDIKQSLSTHWNELPERIRNNTKDFI